MNPKELLLKTIKFEEPESIPHANVIFDIAEQAFGLSYPSEEEIVKARGKELVRLIDRLVEIYALTVEKYDWASIYVWRPWEGPLVGQVIKELKDAVGNKSLVGGFIGHSTWSLESVTDYMKFSEDLFERPEMLKEEAARMVERKIKQAQYLVDAGAETIYLPNDWAFNDGMFFSRDHFNEIVTPYLLKIVREIKKMGVVLVLHSDGNIMDILDILANAGADILQSIDPLAKMDIAEVKKLTYGKIALMGNVDVTLLQEGTTEQLRESAKYCLEHASPGGGYIYCGSNSVFSGAKLERYEEMLNVYHDFNKRNFK